jgi:hypothetical protein
MLLNPKTLFSNLLFGEIKPSGTTHEEEKKEV